MGNGGIMNWLLTPNAPDTAYISGWTQNNLRVSQVLTKIPNIPLMTRLGGGGGES